MPSSVAIAVSIPLLFFASVAATAEPRLPDLGRVAAVQMLGYDKTDIPRPGFDPSEAVVRYIEKAAEDHGKDIDWFINNDPEWIMKRGDEFPVFDLDFGRIGILTCYDGWFPEPFRILSLKGAEILVWINGRRGTIDE